MWNLITSSRGPFWERRARAAAAGALLGCCRSRLSRGPHGGYLFCAALLAVVSERIVLHRYGQACRLLRNGEHRERTIEKRCRGLPRDVICEVHAQRFRPRTILIKRIK